MGCAANGGDRPAAQRTRDGQCADCEAGFFLQPSSGTGNRGHGSPSSGNGDRAACLPCAAGYYTTAGNTRAECQRYKGKCANGKLIAQVQREFPLFGLFLFFWGWGWRFVSVVSAVVVLPSCRERQRRVRACVVASVRVHVRLRACVCMSMCVRVEVCVCVRATQRYSVQ